MSRTIAIGSLVVGGAIALRLLACTSNPGSTPGSTDGTSGPAMGVGAADVDAKAIPLASIPFAELTVPPDNRPGDAEPPVKIPLDGTWRYIGSTRKDMHKYATEIPIRPRGLFFHRAQPGIRLTTADGTEIRYDRTGKSDTFMWAHDRKELIVYYPDRTGPPSPGQFVLEYPKATEREAQLNQRWSGREAKDFVWTTIQDDWDNRRGLLLPAPGVAAWDVTVPPAGELTFVGGLVEPEIKTGAPSDGAKIAVEVEVDGKVEPLASVDVALHAFTPHHVDLARYAGKQVRLRVRTEPGATPTYDYVFLAEPVLASRKANPVRVVMVFIDTLRPDHMSLYGYERDTTAAIDHLAAEGAVFTDAHSVAPWTLPSARSIVTGRHPEYYDNAPTVQSILRDRGWATAFVAGNVYLSVNFDMERDWDFHRVGLWPLAEETTDDALRWLDEHPGRDALIQVHYMSTHLPYVEPPSYRHKYAGEGTGALREEFHLSDVRKANIDEDADAQQYVKDRYDNNVRYATDQVQRIVEVLDDNDVLVLFADHGEEFWDHQGFEHGHTLYEELLHVPVVIRAPGVVPRKIGAPVSLLDLTPTILDLAGAPIPPDLDGRSLVPLLKDQPAADQPFLTRDLAVGRPLYGTERWGVLHGDEKWTTHEGKEYLFDLGDDPVEKKNLLKSDESGGAPYREYLAKSLGREVGAAYRLLPTNHRGGPPIPGLWALCTVPGGFKSAWKADDPLENSAADVKLLTDPAEIAAALARYGIKDHPVGADAGAAEICWHAGWFGSREVYTVPNRPLADVGREMVCSAYLGDRSGGHQGTMRIPTDRDPTIAGPRTPALAKLSLDQRQLAWSFGIAPIPNERTLALSGREDETNEMLEAMGYVDPEKPEGKPEGKPGDKDDKEPARPLVACEPPAAP
ncbi:MAG: sulfatase [Myxococcota bacterium]